MWKYYSNTALPYVAWKKSQINNIALNIKEVKEENKGVKKKLNEVIRFREEIKT